jgi:endo-1,4-beta-xylanase
MYTEPGQNQYNYTEGDYIVRLAEENGQAVRCHNLVWNNELSNFVNQGTWNAQTLTQVLKNHIFNVVQHFGKRCYSWDVVNEALNGDGTFSSSIWYDTIGEEYFFLAFQYAMDALAQIGAHEVKLYYNDYGIENPGAKVNATIDLVHQLRKRGIRIDGVGLESHFIVGETPSLAQQVATKQLFIQNDLDLVMTELDIRFAEVPYYTAAVLQQQAQDYYTSVQSCLHAGPRCRGIVVWDFDDAYSWVPSTFAGQGAACLFNDTLEAKPAYFAVADALEGKPCSVC